MAEHQEVESVTTVLVSDEISEEDAQHIQMFFGCIKCKQSFNDAHEVLAHVRSGLCPGEPARSEPQPTVPKRKRGRPRKDQPDEECKAAKKKAASQDDDDFVPPPVDFTPGRRATRVSTGVIQRRSILDIIGDASARKDSVLIEDEASMKKTPKPPCDTMTPRRRGRPKKVDHTAVENGHENIVSDVPKIAVQVSGVHAQVGDDTDSTTVWVTVATQDAPNVTEQCHDETATEVENCSEQVKGSNYCEEESMDQLENVGKADTEVVDGEKLNEAGDRAVEDEEVEVSLPHHLGDGDDDDDDYQPGDGDSEAEEDAELDEQMEEEIGAGDVLEAVEISLKKEKEIIRKEVSNFIAKQLVNAKMTEMGGSHVFEISPEDFVNENLSTKAIEKQSNKSDTRIITVSRLDDAEFEEIKLKLEDLEEREESPRAKYAEKRGPGRPRKDASGFTRHPRKRSIKCAHCPMRFFSTVDELELHVQCHTHVSHEADTYKCIACTYTTKSWNRCLDHIFIHPDLKESYKEYDFSRNLLGDYECPVCKKKFEKKHNLSGHLLKVHYKKEKICDICEKVFQNMDEKTFARHVEKCKAIEHSCPHCKYKTYVSANFRRHMRIHTGEGFKCETCRKMFPTHSRYRAHIAIHDTNRPKTTCDVCGQEFMSEDAAKKHIIRAHAEVHEILQCDRCSFTAKLESDLKKHVNLVHFKRYNCDQCVYSTNSSIAFEQHKEYHSPSRRFACTYNNCFYKGQSAKHLVNHVCQVHQLMSKHQCPICQKTYKKKTHLARHLVVHTGDKPYVCLDCGTAFANHSTYYRHRARTGHDTKREGIVSVPQNITIQYVTQDSDLGLDEQQIQEGDLVAVESIDAEVEQENTVVLGELPDGEQVTYLLHIDENGQQVMVPASEEVLLELQKSQEAGLTTTELLEEGQQLLQQLDTIELSQEQVIVQDNHHCAIQQVQQHFQEIHTTELQENSVVVETGATQETVLMDGEQQFLYEGTDGSIHTVVEVENPSGDSGQQQYAIVVLPENQTAFSGAEPEAALSMLQLQSSMQQ